MYFLFESQIEDHFSEKSKVAITYYFFRFLFIPRVVSQPPPACRSSRLICRNGGGEHANRGAQCNSCRAEHIIQWRSDAACVARREVHNAVRHADHVHRRARRVAPGERGGRHAGGR